MVDTTTSSHTTPLKLSATIITYNEEKNIARCLDSIINVVEDIVVVDSYSTDGTEKICSDYGVRFVKNEFAGYREQKNFALTLTKHNYVLSLDADEALDQEAQHKIVKLMDNPQYDGYYLKRFNNYCGQWIRFTDWGRDKKLRLFNKNKAKWGGINPHDKVVQDTGTTSTLLSGKILHWGYSNYQEHNKKIRSFSTIAAREYFLNNRSVSYISIALKPLWRFFRSYVLRLGFLEGKKGFFLCYYCAKNVYLKYLKLHHLYQKQHPSHS